MENKVELSAQDKLEIFDLRSIQDGFLRGKGRKAMIFEYFASFERNCLYDVIRELNLDFQVKIVKERYESVREEILSARYLNFKGEEEENDKYAIVFENGLTGRDSMGLRSVSEEEVLSYKIGDYIHRHYIILSAYDSEKINMEKAIYGLLSKVKDKSLIMRQLMREDLKEYLFNWINFPDTIHTGITPFSRDRDGRDGYILDELDEGVFGRITTYLGGMNNAFWSLASRGLKSIEHIYFHRSIPEVSTDVVKVFEQNMYKGTNFFQVGGIYKGGLLIVKGIPKSDFNILDFLFKNLQHGDSITLNLYPGDYHEIEAKTENLGGLKKIYGTEDKTSRDGETYLQMVITFNEVSDYLLESRIGEFQGNIDRDFFTQRIEQNMSRFMQTAMGTGINKLQHEWSYPDERLRKNLLF